MTIRYYFGIVDYVSGTVNLSLDWSETVAGVAPYLDTTGLPAGQGSIIFADPVTEGGAAGTATITSTVNGVPSISPIIAVVDAPPPPTPYDYYGYFAVNNFSPEPGIYPTFTTYDGNYPQTVSLGNYDLQSNNPSDAVGSLTTNGWNGNWSVGAGTGASINISPMSVSTIRTYTLVGETNIVTSRFYFPMKTGDSVFLVARTGSGDNGFGLYTAGTMTVIVGPSDTVGERYLISWPEQGFSTPPDSFISMERLTNIGAR